MTLKQKLVELGEAMDAGLITQEEHQAAKATLLAGMISGAPATTDTATLSEHFRAAEEERVWPWRADQRRATIILKQFSDELGAGDCETRLRDMYIAKAKAGQLTALEVLVGQYLLFATNADAGRAQLMQLILRIPPSDRTSIHNWNIVSGWGLGDTMANGAAIACLRGPLFPAHPALEALNAKLLLELS